jgi:hypothetical protein
MNASIASNWRPLSRSLSAILIVIAALWVFPRNASAQAQSSYVTNQNGDSISGYAVDPATGALTSIAGSPFPTGLGPVDIAFTGSSVSITSPSDGAKPRSRYVALTGMANPRDTVTLLIDGAAVYTTFANSSGHWEQVVKAGEGPHRIQAVNGSSTSNVIRVDASPPPKSPELKVDPGYTLLRNADIVLASLPRSPQYLIYGAVYTHVALFIGGDAEGTPLIAEAVTPDEANGFGEVRSVPIEESLDYIFHEGSRIDFFRPSPPESLRERNAIAAWAKSVVNQGRLYWTREDFLDFGLAFAYWKAGWTGLLDSRLKELDKLKFSTARFICSTLVWRAYYEGTDHAIDLSTPNKAGSKEDPLFQTDGIPWPDSFIKVLQPHFVFPDTIARCGKVFKVAQ